MALRFVASGSTTARQVARGPPLPERKCLTAHKHLWCQSLVDSTYGPMKHDIVTIGGSAGAVDVLLGMASKLPADLPAALLVAIHTRPDYESALPQLLSSRGPLQASHPVHQEEIKPGRIYVAPPDNHILVRDGAMHVVRGPAENGHRPAVDPLFRTAAACYGPRVIAVVLSGYLDCGTAGMLSVKARGGLGVVQDPDSALAPDMPRSAIEHAQVDHVVRPLELPGLLVRLVRTKSGQTSEPDESVSRIEGTAAGNPAELVCPTCQGVLTEAHSGEFRHFRCHVGHAFSLESLVREQSEELERALWAAVRALQESAALSERLSRTQSPQLSGRFAEKAATQKQQADFIQQILLHGNRLSKTDSPLLSPRPDRRRGSSAKPRQHAAARDRASNGSTTKNTRVKRIIAKAPSSKKATGKSVTAKRTRSRPKK